MGLTTEQQKAAGASGSAAVTAGAGTGKTLLLAHRYMHHVREHDLSPLEIVAVTFTEKAADELRSRIRRTLAEENLGDRVVAEVEAAQISTIHALAARICRDFYDLAGIPADFSVLDETESPLWQVEKFEEGFGTIDRAVIQRLGFTWLAAALRELLKDPAAAEQSLALGSKNWREFIERESAAAIKEFIDCSSWQEAELTLPHTCGVAGDILEDARASALAAMDSIRGGENVADAITTISRLRSHLGKASNWTADGKDRIGGCLKALKEVATQIAERATLIYGVDDEEAASRIEPLAAAFAQVREFLAAEKLRENVLDFNDLERYALKVLDHPEAVEHYQHRWKAFLVDEFQDTNQVQAEILDRLTRIAKLTIVGDEKQSIYGFRGADPNVFSRVRDEIVEIRGGQHVPLTKTYRAHHGLVEAMNLIFAPVLDVLHQPLEAARVDSQLSEPFLHSAVVGESRGTPKSRLQILEARYIADQIKSLHDEQNVAYKDIAILARRWAPLEVYLGVLSANGIPAVNVGGGSLLETREAKDIYALFSFLSEPSDAIPLAAVLRSPFFAVSDLTLLNAAPELNNRSWWRAIQDRPEFAHAVDILNTLLDARQLSSSEQILSLALSLTGYESVIANLPYGTRRVADLRGMRELFQRLERKGRGDTFGTTRYLRELIETETDIPRPQLAPGEAVSLMTIHRAKGLEWPVVFVPDLACERYVDNAKVLIDSEVGIAFQMDGEAFEKQQPAIHKLIRARKREREAAEARRLLYVAITRAKDKVILTATRKGSTREKDLDIDILRPGLDAAGIEDEIIPYVEALAVAPAPIEPAALPVPDEINIGPVRTSLRELPATSLTVYAKCPKRFEYQFVNGHPGIGEGYASAMAIGSLTHIALENDITDPAALLRFSPESTAEQAREAIELANAFRENPAFASVRSGVLSTEEPFRYDAGPIGINGVADLVGMDFVLDYKTDAEVDRDEHRFQLWAYAEAFKKEKAYVAYLRHNKLIEYTCDELARSREDAHLMLDKIAGGVFEATPSEKACSACAYRSICDKKYEGAIAVEVGAQLSLF